MSSLSPFLPTINIFLRSELNAIHSVCLVVRNKHSKLFFYCFFNTGGYCNNRKYVFSIPVLVRDGLTEVEPAYITILNVLDKFDLDYGFVLALIPLFPNLSMIDYDSNQIVSCFNSQCVQFSI